MASDYFNTTTNRAWRLGPKGVACYTSKPSGEYIELTHRGIAPTSAQATRWADGDDSVTLEPVYDPTGAPVVVH